MKNSHGEEIKYNSRIEKYHSKTKATKHKKQGRKIVEENTEKLEDIIVMEDAPETKTDEGVIKESPKNTAADSFYISKSELTRGVFDEEFLKAEAEAKAKKEAEERAKREAEEKAIKEAEEKARKEAEEKAKKEAEEKARKEAEEKAKKEAKEKARKEAKEKAAEIPEETENLEEAQAATRRIEAFIADDDAKFENDELAKFEADLENIKKAAQEEFSSKEAEEAPVTEETTVFTMPEELIEEAETAEEEVFEGEEETEQKEPKKKISKTAKAWIISIVCVAVAIAAMLLFVFEIVTVDGFSMQPTLNGGEKVIVEKVSRYTEFPQRGQIVATKYDGYDGYYIKRVIAYPGEWVEIYDNTVYINGEELNEDYIPSGTAYDNMELIQIPEDHVFVLGDNRAMSLDSRQDTIGFIHESNILGNAWCVIWPFEDIRIID